MKLSSKAHYGLQACQILAGRYGDAVSATELEEKIGVSGKYLEKSCAYLRKIPSLRRAAARAEATCWCGRPKGPR